MTPQMEPVRIFVGSDVWQLRTGAEAALEESIAANTTPPWEIHWMRATPVHEALEGDQWAISRQRRAGAWNVGCEPGMVYPPAGGWATPFTGFRWAIPQLCGFQGHAIYQDADMIDVGDMRELWELGKASGRAVYLSAPKACVMVLDCARFAEIPWWPSIEKQRAGGETMYDLRARLVDEGHVDGSMPRAWNFPDSYREGVKICHYTNARTQPWRAYEHATRIQTHPDPNAVALWSRYYAEARRSGRVIGEARPSSFGAAV